ncbi:hypothetical protein G6F57_004373 [Rhizopus arrhizus]|uniref:Protein BFR2 n=1 Tax=Rhizopus oryzae TaxID=64495 RepID=A0A9P6XKV2_RHIOR|nr:hypothetical protein G6F30_003070 [Rhizopus arrhizus]KAG1416991.1 hypothetical protein G6F58_005698 [Rhizopus delemar]KAG0989189.1 hypothetical protein G6F29_001172 [Rhizopus arrhizus]KAG0995873.1 hypothetical protein G6F28_004382 [Rhizopus arrhizus]KAG1011937.1 hypothetical protein G6F27_003291 [Rhizopus arrhizus]
MSKKNTSLADLIADIESTAPVDYDPEDTHEPFQDDVDQGNASDNQDEGNESTAHYVSVGKSKLRSEQQPVLDDPRYAGKQTSRKDIFSEDEEEDEWQGIQDEDSAEDTDSEEEENNAEDDFDDDEDLMTAANNKEDDEEKESEDEEDSDEEVSGEGSEYEDASDDQEENDDDQINAELRKIQEEEKQIISQLSKSAQSDVEKGQHVRQQLTLWDNCLENRIRMQKVIDNANKLPQNDTWIDFLTKTEGIEEDLEQVKTDLREVIDDLMDIRVGLFEQNGCIDLSKKNFNSRKRYMDDDDDIYIEKLWKDMSEINDVFVPFRNSTLEKWSNKVQVAAGARLNKKFKAFDQNIMTQIENVLHDKENLVKRTQLQRSDYKIIGKVQVEAGEVEEEIDSGKKADRHLNTYDVEIFDDQDFYQQQLRELIESRMVDTSDPTAIGMRWAARKNEQKKKKKAVNTKASKGRQLRFNVHEKLQNFMAPIPAGGWHDEMVDELFSSLLGQKLDDNLAE